MSLQNFVAKVGPTVKAVWLNMVDLLANSRLTGVDSGVVNAYVVALPGTTGASFQRSTGAVVRFTTLNTNTGPATLNVAGTGVAAVLEQFGGATAGGEIVSNLINVVQWTGTAWQIVGNTVTPNNKRVVPTGFSWAGIVPTFCSAPGNAEFTEDVTAWANRVYTLAGLFSPGELYVDGVNGNDANGGGIADPVKTIGRAVRELNPSTVYVYSGIYAPFDYRSTDAVAPRFKQVIALGPVMIRVAADDPPTATWTVDGTFGNVYWMPLTPANLAISRVLDLSKLDIYGQPFPLEKRTSIVLCNNVNTDPTRSYGSWFHDTGANRLYVRMGIEAGSSFRAKLKIVTGDAGATARCLVSAVPLLFSGDWHFEGIIPWAIEAAGVRGTLMMHCVPSLIPTCAYSPDSGVESEGSDTYLQGIWVHRAQRDNLHYTTIAVNDCRGVEINCTSTYAGDYQNSAATSSDGTSNASSMHGTLGTIIRINGLYTFSDGPDVPDAAGGGTWNVGSICYGSTIVGNSYGFYTLQGTLWLDTCWAKNELNADIRAEVGQIRVFQTQYLTTSTASGGTIITYRVQVPG